MSSKNTRIKYEVYVQPEGDFEQCECQSDCEEEYDYVKGKCIPKDKNKQNETFCKGMHM